jgi:hypothetical protein
MSTETPCSEPHGPNTAGEKKPPREQTSTQRYFASIEAQRAIKDGCWPGKAMLRQVPTRFSQPELVLALVLRPLLEQAWRQRQEQLSARPAF